MGVFSDFAPLYWDAGIPVMPLKRRSKSPILNEWSSYGTNFPTIAEREHWLRTYPDCNLGLPFGEASGLCAIDIDTVDPVLVEAIMDCLPASPWTRIGRKGCGLIYKWQGQKNFKVRSEDGMLCEFLGKGNQLVLPPSIHPDCPECGQKNAAGPAGVCSNCGAPSVIYTSNTNLWEVLDKVQPLGADIEERLREALGVRGHKLQHEGRSAPMTVVPEGERDIQLVRRAGYYARVVLGIDKSEQFTLSEAMQHMWVWVEQFTSSVSGDDMDPAKGVAKLLEFLLRDVQAGKTMPNGWDRGLTEEQRAHPTILALGACNESQRWTRTKAREWLAAELAGREEDEDFVLEKIEELLTGLAKDDQFTPLQLDTVYADTTKKFGKIISKPVFVRTFRDARAGDTMASEEDHEAIARRVLEIINRDGELRHANGSFWQWNGSCFESLKNEAVVGEVTKVKGNVLCRRTADYVAVAKLIGIIARKDLMEDEVLGVNFANGFLDVDGELHEHSPRFGKTFTMPFNYAPERASGCHKWLAFLERVWGDDPDYSDKVAALQEAFAATMFGTACQYQRAILLFGLSGTGKSTVLEVLRAMMPPSATCKVPPQEWGKQFSLTGMIGKTLNICGELSESMSIAGDKFKEVVEGSTQTTEFKGQDKFSFKPIAANWFASNFPPISRDGSGGFLRRWLILTFNHRIRLEEKQTDYHQILVAEEREAIAAWAIQAIGRLQRNQDYTLPSSHYEEINSVKRANNDVAAWLESNGKVLVSEADTTDAMVCYDHFKWYQRDVIGMTYTRVSNFERFKQMMSELGHKDEKYTDALGTVRYKFKGIKSLLPQLT